MARKKKSKKINIPKVEEKSEVKEEVKSEKTSDKKYILTKDVNLSLKKGQEVSEQKYKQMIDNGLGAWFE